MSDRTLVKGLSRRDFVKAVGAAGAVAALGFPTKNTAVAADAKPNKLRFGVQTHPQRATYQEIVDVWKESDELGFDSAFVFDHFMPIRSDPTDACFEGWTLLSALAAQTRRLSVGVLVTGNTYRHPAVLAKMAATVDHVSNGRLILGIGAGWFELEHTAYGIPFHTVGQRGRRLGEAVEMIKKLFTQDRSSFEGKYYRLQDAPFSPKCVQRPHPPILIGGMGPKLIQPVAARHGDIWHFFVEGNDPAEVKQVAASFDELCRKLGRDPAQVEKSTSLRAPDLAGKAKQVRARVQSLADSGVRHLILSLSSPFDRPALRRFAKEVMPAFRTA